MHKCTAFARYHVKKDSTDVYQQSKKAYCVSRGITWTVQNKRPVKLKDKIKELEVFMRYVEFVVL